MQEPRNRELTQSGTEALTRRSHFMIGCLLIISSAGVLIALMNRRQLRSVSHLLHSESETLRSHMTLAEQDDPIPEETASLWKKLMDHLPEDMQDLGMTKRQAQVGMGVIQQKTYQEIAKEVRLNERTVRLHASSAFHKVGCTKRSEFLNALMATIESSSD